MTEKASPGDRETWWQQQVAELRASLGEASRELREQAAEEARVRELEVSEANAKHWRATAVKACDKAESRLAVATALLRGWHLWWCGQTHAPWDATLAFHRNQPAAPEKKASNSPLEPSGFADLTHTCCHRHTESSHNPDCRCTECRSTVCNQPAAPTTERPGHWASECIDPACPQYQPAAPPYATYCSRCRERVSTSGPYCDSCLAAPLGHGDRHHPDIAGYDPNCEHCVFGRGEWVHGNRHPAKAWSSLCPDCKPASPQRCPSCDSPEPHVHPSVLCTDRWHIPPAAPTRTVYEVWVGTEKVKERIVKETTDIEEAAHTACADLSGCTFWGMKAPARTEDIWKGVPMRPAQPDTVGSTRTEGITRWMPCPAEPEEDDDGPLFQGFLTHPQGEWVKWADVAAPTSAECPRCKLAQDALLEGTAEAIRLHERTEAEQAVLLACEALPEQWLRDGAEMSDVPGHWLCLAELARRGLK